MRDFLEGLGFVAAIAGGFLLIVVICFALFATGDHLATEVYPICAHGDIAFKAIVSDDVSNDRTIQVFVDGKRIARIKVDPDKWESLSAAMRKPFVGCKP